MNWHELEQHKHRLRIADSYAANSPDPSSKMGAVLYNQYGVACGFGWNSFPTNMVVDKAYYHDRALKYDRVIHAEMRCLLMAGPDTYGASLYTGCPPCKECAKHVAEARVKTVYWWTSRMKHSFVQRYPENIQVSMQLFAECDIKVIPIPDLGTL